HAGSVPSSLPLKGVATMVFHGVDVKKQFKRMRELAPEAYRAFLDFDGKAFADGALALKTKELIAIGIANITQCQCCIDAPARHTPPSARSRTRTWKSVGACAQSTGLGIGGAIEDGIVD